MKLTKANAQRITLAHGAHETIVFDEVLRGFGLRVREGGKRTWIVQYRIGRKQRRVTLGTVEAMDADQARAHAKSTISKAQLGIDTQLEKIETRAQASVTLGEVVKLYLSRRASQRLKPRSLAEVERHLQKHWAALAEMPAQKVSRAQVAAQLGRIAGDNGPFAANRARAALSALYGWAIGEGLADANPVVGTNVATAELARDRVLSPDELKLVWQEAGEGEYGAILRLLVLTGQRREEVGGMLWSELDLKNGLWRIGAERAKNGLAHEVPLSEPAIAILEKQARRDDRDMVFGAGDGAFQGWSNAKSALDRRTLKRLRENNATAALLPWRLHDVRRTVATRLADLGVLPHVIEAVLNHISGHKAGVAGVYNRASYGNEKRQALAMWATHLLSIVDGLATSVAPLKKAG